MLQRHFDRGSQLVVAIGGLSFRYDVFAASQTTGDDHAVSRGHKRGDLHALLLRRIRMVNMLGFPVLIVCQIIDTGIGLGGIERQRLFFTCPRDRKLCTSQRLFDAILRCVLEQLGRVGNGLGFAGIADLCSCRRAVRQDKQRCGVQVTVVAVDHALAFQHALIGDLDYIGLAVVVKLECSIAFQPVNVDAEFAVGIIGVLHIPVGIVF